VTDSQAGRGELPASAPREWETMLAQLKTALEPAASKYLPQRRAVLEEELLYGKPAYVREYEALIQQRKNRLSGIQLAASDAPVVETPQTVDIPDILAFHRTPAAARWRSMDISGTTPDPPPISNSGST